MVYLPYPVMLKEKTARKLTEYVEKGVLLIGSFPGAGYFRRQSAEPKTFFAGLLESANVAQRVCSSDPDVKARLHEGPEGKYLWVVNPTRKTREVTIRLIARDAGLCIEKDVWQGKPVTADGDTVKVTVGDRDVAVMNLSRLRRGLFNLSA
ncbi:MAG TPA: hypothetical protein VMW24_17710 [Sedimentisphaerales bacterium]|nr:hypothetical protein [Sedimentisphaerales bacterium]